MCKGTPLVKQTGMDYGTFFEFASPRYDRCNPYISDGLCDRYFLLFAERSRDEDEGIPLHSFGNLLSFRSFLLPFYRGVCLAQNYLLPRDCSSLLDSYGLLEQIFAWPREEKELIKEKLFGSQDSKSFSFFVRNNERCLRKLF